MRSSFVFQRPARTLMAGLLALLSVLGARAAFAAEPPWPAEPFALGPAEMLRLADSVPVPDGADAHLLLDEKRFVFDEQRRETSRHWRIYEIHTPAGVELLGDLVAVWRPWNQQRPTVRARVITPDGRDHPLDPQTLTEVPAYETQQGVSSGLRMLVAPLPVVAPGVLVEIEREVTETAPFFDGGSVTRSPFASSVPAHRFRLVVESPENLPLRFITELLPAIEPRTEELAGRRRWTYEGGPFDAFEPFEPFTPGETPLIPVVGFSTGESWAAVARRYAEVVDEQIGGAALESLAQDITRGAETRRERIESIHGWLRTAVRYSGLPFGESGLVPGPPAETLERGYGDCKDQSALLVAMLRAAGISAHVALLSIGPGRDVRATLPGLGDFDHAIIHIPGDPGWWIDPTDEFARTGELPVANQGRLALIAAPGTTGLEPTPDAASADNRQIVTTEIHLRDMDEPRITETSRLTGSIERQYRQFFQQSKRSDLQDYLEERARTALGSERLERWEHSEPTDLTTAFELRLETEGCTQVATTIAEVAVFIHPAGSTTDRLPGILTGDLDDTERELTKRSFIDIGDEPRRHDLVLPEPFVCETRFRIFPPAGYRPLSVPEPEVSHLGPATLSTASEVSDDGVVEVTRRFDSGKRRLRPEEVDALRRRVRELRAAEPVAVRFEHVGETLLAAGEVGEALTELRRLAALEPRRALPRTRVARALLAAGLGAAARREARAAVELEPDLEWAHQALGFVLSHDLCGRYHAEGFDRDGAATAYRKAKEVNPDEGAHRYSLAITLEVDADGQIFGSGASLDEAIAEYRSLRDELGVTDYEADLLLALVMAGRFEEVEELARDMEPSIQQNAALLAAVAARAGPAAVAREAARLRDVTQRQEALVGAGFLFLHLRRYPEAAELFEVAAGGQVDPALAVALDVFRGIRRWQEVLLPDDDPRGVVQRQFIDLLEDDRGTEVVPEALDQLAQAIGLSMENLRDLALSAQTITTEEGDETLGYRVRSVIGTDLQEEPSVQHRFVTRSAGRYLVLSGGPELGVEASKHLNLGNRGAARQWLDWALEVVPQRPVEDVFDQHPFHRFWPEGSDANPETIRYAAASLVAFGDQAEAAIPTLRAGRDEARSGEERLSFDLGLARAYWRLNRHEDLLPIARRWLAEKPDSEVAFHYSLKALRGLQRWRDFRQVAQRRLKQLPGDRPAVRALAELALLKGDLEGTIRRFREIVKLGLATPGDLNNLAWSSLASSRLDEETVEHAEEAARRSGARPTLHTLASVYAAMGRNREARDTMWKAMLAGRNPIHHEDWLVWGRIAENYDLQEVAREAYRKVQPPRRDSIDSSYNLAQGRLEKLAGTPDPGNT
ncbi:MAG: DUF3857 domain-containing protein [bacterium]|nr:DUF3857 domain-containing protein [bacterium]